MEVSVIKAKKDYKCIESKQLRVAAYARVSTENENQISSFKSQLIYYENKIKENPNWEFVKVYADDGISGTRVANRKGFIELIKDCFDNKIDLVLTKSISRFARNTSDLLSLTRRLKTMNIGIYFEEERINTLNMDSEFLLTVLASVAQQESLNTSEHVRKGIEFIVKSGNVRTISKIFGYDLDRENRTYIVNKKEARIVRKIFKMYIDGYETSEIVNYLNKRNIKANSKSGKWKRDNIHLMFNNRSYVGDYVQGRFKGVNGAKVINKDKSKIYIIKNHHEAIIDIDTWNKVQEIKKNNNLKLNDKASYNFNECFENKIRCGFCGATCGKSIQYERIFWRCFKTKARKCDRGKKIDELVLENLFLELLKYIYLKSDKELIGKINLLIYENKVNEKNKNDLSSKLSIILNEYLNKKISYGTYYHKEQELIKKISFFESQIGICQNKIDNLKQIKDKLSEWKKEIKEEDLKVFNKVLFMKMIKFIILGGYSEKGTTNPFLVRFILKEENVYSFLEKFGVLEKNKIISNPDDYEILLSKKIDMKIRCCSINQRTKRASKILYKYPTITLEVEK